MASPWGWEEMVPPKITFEMRVVCETRQKRNILYYLIMSFPKGLYVDNSTPTFSYTGVEQ